MYTVKYLGQNLPNINPILSGVSFGYFDKPIFFELQAEVVKNPLLISLTIDINEKTDNRFEMGKVEDNKTSLLFHLPSKKSIAGLNAPISFIQNDGFVFAMMFEIESRSDSDIYKITYEMYEGKL